MEKKTYRRMAKSASYEVDIGREFREVKSSIYNLSESINDWKGVFERELTKLNMNMERALNQISDHEARITTLERKQTVDKAEQTVWHTVKTYSLRGASIVVGGVVVILAAYGFAPALKLFNLFAN